jgi:hypothetical protein
MAGHGLAHGSRHVFHDPDLGIVEYGGRLGSALPGQQCADPLVDDPLGRLDACSTRRIAEGIGFCLESAAFRVYQSEIGATPKSWLHGGIKLGSN